VLLCDSQARVTHLNPTAKGVLRSPDEAPDRPLEELEPWLEQVAEAVRQVVARQEVMEGVLACREADAYWQYVVSPVHGHKSRALVVMFDVSERFRAVDRTIRRERHLSHLLEQLPALVWAVDRELRVTYFAGAPLEAMGLRAGRGVHRTLFELLETEDEGHVSIVMHRQALRGQAGNHELEWRGRRFSCRVEPVRDEAGQVVEVVGVALDITDWARAEEEQRRLQGQVEELALKLLRAQEEERRRVAMDVHDGLLQLVAGAAMQLQSYLARRRASVPAPLQRAQELLRLATQEGRRIVSDLQPPFLEERGLAAALRAWLEALSPAVACELAFSCQGEAEGLRLDPLAERSLFRIAQEAVNNALKHSGAPRVEVALHCEGGSLVLTVRDYGRGLKGDAGRGRGLVSMAERAAIIGARLSIDSGPRQGTRIRVEIPCACRR